MVRKNIIPKKSNINRNDVFYINSEIKFKPSEQQLELLRAWLNQYYLGTTKANKMKNGKMTARHFEREIPEFIDAHWAINAVHKLELKIGFNLNGQIADVKWE